MSTASDQHRYVGMWVTADGRIRHELRPDGRYDEVRGGRARAYERYQGRYTLTGDHIDYVDDTGFTADGEFRDGVLHHAGMVFRREDTPADRRSPGKVWFVTGATRGLGRAIAEAALAAGERVVATGRDAMRVAGAVRGDGEAADRLLVHPLDVTDPAQAEAAVAATVARFGRLDVLVNNAGYGQLGHFETVEPDAVARQFDTNVLGLLHVTRAALPVMRRQRSGHVFTLSSVGGVSGYAGASLYCASKFAVEGFSASLAEEMRPFGIRVTIVEPGFFRTDFLAAGSVAYGTRVVQDYADADAVLRTTYGDHDGRQAGDPAKLARALVQLAASAAPPLRWAAGRDAVRVSEDALAARRAELDRWRDLSESTDLEADAPAGAIGAAGTTV